jgi:hypothetical protein
MVENLRNDGGLLILGQATPETKEPEVEVNGFVSQLQKETVKPTIVPVALPN